MKQQKYFKIIVLIGVFGSLIFIIQNCTLIKNLRSVYAEKANVQDFTNDKKQVRFIGMTHFGKKQFYQHVQQLILEAKQQDYVLFYESMGLNQGTEIQQRKIRKMMGFVPSPERYAKFTEKFDAEKFMVQDDSLFFNLVNNLDFNVDITPEILVSEFEKRHGKVQLDSQDWAIPLHESMEPFYATNQVEDIILDFRDKHLASKIMASPYDKIIVIYGANHKSGVFQSLRKLDDKWQKN